MLKKVKSIKEIFIEIKDFDLVITNDAPLATALNKLLETPRLGYLAMTPKQIASKFAQIYYDKIYEKYEVVLKVSNLTKKPVKLIHQIIEKIYEIWMYNAKLEFVEQYLTEDENLILNSIKEFDTIETAMENFNEEFYGNKNIVIVGEELFSLLDLEVLPRRGIPAKKINVFIEDEFNYNYTIDKTYLFNSSEQLIENIVNLISKENADDTAIVLNSDSKFLEILKARFKDSDISIEIKNYLKDDISVRNFISFIEISLRINDLKVKEFIPVAAELGITIVSFYNQYDVNNFIKFINKDKTVKKLYDLSVNVANMTYSELQEQLKKNFEFNYRKELTDVLGLLELSDSKMNEDNLLGLKYFLKAFDIEVNSEKSGVLFVNALNSAFIDREIIFYIGMDNSWMKLFSDKDYMNKEEEEIKNLERFQILLQQGKERFYFVQNVIDYKEVIPCYYFQMLSETNIDSFNNKLFNPYIINNERKKEVYKSNIKKLNITKDIVIDSVSPTSFNRYIKCPKLYSINNLIPKEDLPVFKKGTLLHSFAELYFNHPEYSKKNYKKILDILTAEMVLIFRNRNKEYIQSELQLGMDVIINFLDANNFKKIKLETPVTAKGNELMEGLKKDKIYSNSENWLSEKEITMVTGKIDLQSENTIVDYKSSYNRKSESTISMQSNLDYIKYDESYEFDFQAIAYITSLRRRYKEINFTYNYLLCNYKNQIDADQKVENNLTYIKYLPVTFREYIYSKEVYEKLILKEKSSRLWNAMGYENYKHILDNLNIEEIQFFDKKILMEKIIEVTYSVMDENGMSYSDFGSKMERTFTEVFIKPYWNLIYDIRTG
ncbi:MAG: PD-(D/E)XK nuclease family protein, partial [Ignavibacteria bacterium]|nr:PD-(D/E)XK nuclease family protein [Ignavibacteria bacterium]